MLKPIKDSDILKRYSSLPGSPTNDDNSSLSGSITAFPSSPLDLPSKTFESALKRREKNQQALIYWIRKNLQPDVDYGRIHVVEQCQYARSGVPHQCRDFSHMSMLSLWKAGAEKILNVLGLSVHFPNLHQYELSAVHRVEIHQVVLKCELKTLNGKVVAEGSGARHIKQDDWNLNKAIKLCMKSAVIDATIRVAGLTGLFIKTHQHTARNNLSAIVNRPDNLPPPGVRFNSTSHATPGEKSITDKQKHLIKTISGHKGLTTEGIEKEAKSQFNKVLTDLNRVEAHQFIRHLNDY